MPDSARRKGPARALAEVAAGTGDRPNPCGQRGARPGHGLAGATVPAWPTVALAGSYELLMMIIRSATGPPEQSAQPRETHDLRQMRMAARVRG